MNNQSEADTIDLPPQASGQDTLWNQVRSAEVEVDLGAASHPGLVRSKNEDHYLVVRYGRQLETLLTNLPAGQVPSRSEEIGYGLLVADGIGGAAAGELASRMAISTLINLLLHTPDWIISTGQQETEQVMQRLAERYRHVDAVLRDQCNLDPALCGMGTTMTLASSLGDSLVIGHIGDSRAYLYRGGELHQLTRDHTLVQSLVTLGQLTEEQAGKHPFRHVLTRSLGGGQHGVNGEFQRVMLASGDQVLLCTDGLTDMVDKASIATILHSAASADEACRSLISLALKNGGKDNVTVALARYRFPG